MKNLKTLFVFALAVISVFSLAVACYANEDRIPGVFDSTATLDTETVERANELAENALGEYGYSIVVVLVDSVSEDEIQKIAEDYYSDNGFSRYGGIQLYIGVNSRKYDIFRPIDGKSTRITEAELDEIESATIEYLRRSDFDGAVTKFVSLCVEKIGNDEIQEYVINGKSGADVFKIVGISLVIGIAVGLIVVMIMKSGMKTVRQQATASGYMIKESFNLSGRRDRFLYSRITKTRKPENNSSGGSSRSSGGSHRSGSF